MHQDNKFAYDSSERREQIMPEPILRKIGLKPGMTFLDIGCNQGFFSIPAARIVGQQGRVIGFDPDAPAVEQLKQNAKKEGLNNLDAHVGSAETIALNTQVDVAFCAFLLHHFPDPVKALNNIKILLKASGIMVIVDLIKADRDFGPPKESLPSDQEVLKMIEESGLKVLSNEKLDKDHYLLIAA